METGSNAELLGASDSNLEITSAGTRTTVKLDSGVREKVSESLESASMSASPQPNKVYLRLENVRGTMDAFKLKVTVNQQPAGTVALFGLRRASQQDGQHGGEGLSFVLDITNIIDNLFLNNAFDVDSLDVRIEPNHAVSESTELSVGRVSVYRRG